MTPPGLLRGASVDFRWRPVAAAWYLGVGDEIAPGTSAFIRKLAVRRAWAKKGVSTELLSFARAHARALARPYLRLDCVADRLGLRDLYEHFGFAVHSVIRKGTVSFARDELQTTQ